MVLLIVWILVLFLFRFLSGFGEDLNIHPTLGMHEFQKKFKILLMHTAINYNENQTTACIVIMHPRYPSVLKWTTVHPPSFFPKQIGNTPMITYFPPPFVNNSHYHRKHDRNYRALEKKWLHFKFQRYRDFFSNWVCGIIYKLFS